MPTKIFQRVQHSEHAALTNTPGPHLRQLERRLRVAVKPVVGAIPTFRKFAPFEQNFAG